MAPKSVGVQRQYTGAAGRVENAQVALFLTCAAERGHTSIDRRLYQPESWARDLAGVPDDVEFATKPHLTAIIITKAGPGRGRRDEVYGAEPHLRATCRRRGLGYVLAIGCNRAVPTGLDRCAPTGPPAYSRPGPGADVVRQRIRRTTLVLRGRP